MLTSFKFPTTKKWRLWATVCARICVSVCICLPIHLFDACSKDAVLFYFFLISDHHFCHFMRHIEHFSKQKPIIKRPTIFMTVTSHYTKIEKPFFFLNWPKAFKFNHFNMNRNDEWKKKYVKIHLWSVFNLLCAYAGDQMLLLVSFFRLPLSITVLNVLNRQRLQIFCCCGMKDH